MARVHTVRTVCTVRTEVCYHDCILVLNAMSYAPIASSWTENAARMLLSTGTVKPKGLSEKGLSLQPLGANGECCMQYRYHATCIR